MNCRHIEANKLEGDCIVVMEYFVVTHFDFVVRNYSVDVRCLAFEIPKSICDGQRISSTGRIARYTDSCYFTSIRSKKCYVKKYLHL